MNKILVLGMGFVFLGSQAVSAAPIKRYGTQPPADIIINNNIRRSLLKAFFLLTDFPAIHKLFTLNLLYTGTHDAELL